MLVEGFGWCAPAEDLAWPRVDGGCDGIDVFAGPSGEVGALGEVLAQQSVGVLVHAALPGAVGIREEHVKARVDLQLGVLGEFLAAVPGQ